MQQDYIKIYRDKRFCITDIEDEYQFILVCPMYLALRSKLIKKYYWCNACKFCKDWPSIFSYIFVCIVHHNKCCMYKTYVICNNEIGIEIGYWYLYCSPRSLPDRIPWWQSRFPVCWILFFINSECRHYIVCILYDVGRV